MNEGINIFSQNIIKIANDKTYYGSLSDYSCSANVKGICGDAMEFFIKIEDNKIKDVKFCTTGCISSKACGNTATKLIYGKDIYDALKLSPRAILDELENLPSEHHHCAILSCITVYKAVGEYFC